MISVKDIEKETMSEEKRKEAHNNIFAFYIGRPLSYYLTIPFLYINISPNAITFISIILLVIGYFFFQFGNTKIAFLIGWLFFFLWNLFDGIDGNVARYKKAFSKNGDLWDTTAGYFAMVVTYMSAAVSAYKMSNIIIFKPYVYLIMGGWTAVLSIFPRLVLHKKKSSQGDVAGVKELSDKNSFSIIKIIALNIISVTSFLQVIWLICIIFNVVNCFVVFYFIVNLLVALGSLYKLLKM
ncbi:MAG: CDP-alcohol phosphatidyltransferase family protein [Ruminococcus flavefaciens]|nr:CDP-alcohol phosphatidyltransferase family protein [Ruminococcus flavefaciens]